jgi:hypothetical protein
MPYVPICIVDEAEARSLTHAGIGERCRSRRHHHFSRAMVDGLVKSGELIWVGKHKKVATFLNARSWIKTYTRNRFGEVISCGMQLVRGEGAF